MRVLYMHPPKCAGTSVVRALRLRFLWKGVGLSAHSMREVLNGYEPPLSYPDYQVKAHQAADAVAAHRISNGSNLVAGHFWYGYYLRLLDDSVYRMTVMRDPVPRFLSHYRYLVWKYGLEEDLPEFLASDRAKQLGSIYGFYFANRYPESPLDEDAIVELAVESLRRFKLIGDVSDIRKFLRAAKSTIGGPLIALRSNRTPGSVRPNISAEVTPQDMSRIEEVTSVDQRIYDEVRQMPNYIGSCAAPTTVDRQRTVEV